jgi:hypothetical protein
VRAKPEQVPVACQNYFPDRYEVFTIEPSFDRNSELGIKNPVIRFAYNFFLKNVKRHNISLL